MTSGAMRDRGPRRVRRRDPSTAVCVLPPVRRRSAAELTTLAETIETRWPAIEVVSLTELTNARTGHERARSSR